LPESLEELVISRGDVDKFTVCPPNLKRLYLFGGCVESYKEKMKTIKRNGLINFDIYELNYPDYEPELLELF
jgi:hypothetical protein